jgi:hypothetical protein
LNRIEAKGSSKKARASRGSRAFSIAMAWLIVDAAYCVDLSVN